MSYRHDDHHFSGRCASCGQMCSCAVVDLQHEMLLLALRNAICVNTGDDIVDKEDDRLPIDRGLARVCALFRGGLCGAHRAAFAMRGMLFRDDFVIDQELLKNWDFRRI